MLRKFTRRNLHSTVSSIQKSYSNGVTIEPKFSEFSRDMTQVEIAEYLNLTGIHFPDDRPYTWLSSLASFDGVMENPSLLAFKSRFDQLRQADLRILHTSWAQSDAVLLSSNTLRLEKATVVKPNDSAMQHRSKFLRRLHHLPVQVILSRSGEFPVSHPIFSTDNQKTIVFLPQGSAVDTVTSSFKANGRHLQIHDTEKHLSGPGGTPFPISNDIHVFVFPPDNYLRNALRFLRHNLGIMHLDCSTGPTIASKLVELQALDEIRHTLSGQLVGGSTTKTTLFKHFSSSTTPPLIEFRGIRTLSPQNLPMDPSNLLLFLRAFLHYTIHEK